VSPGFKRSLFDDEERPLLLRGWVGRVYRTLSEDIWRLESKPLGVLRRALRRAGRLAFLTLSGFVSDRCVVRASALTFVTVLSLVPLLAFSFAALKGMGVYKSLNEEVIQPGLDRLLPQDDPPPEANLVAAVEPDVGGSEPEPEPEPESGAAEPGTELGATAQSSPLRDSIQSVLTLVDKTDFKALGTIGLLVVLWAILRLLGTIEGAFNEIWGVRRSRSFVRKVTDYLAIVVITPIFLVIAVGLTSAAQTSTFGAFLNERLGLGTLVNLAVKFMPLLAGWIAFTFLYMALPNTRTRFRSAALGGFVAGTAWQVALLAHVQFQVGVANYSKIYSTFAALPIFLVWVQVSWVIVLFGAELAFAHQHEHDYRRVVGWREATPVMREAVALRVLSRAVAAFLQGSGTLDAEQVATELGVPGQAVEDVLEALLSAGIVAQAGDPEEGRWLLARDPAGVRVADVLDVLEGEGADRDVAVLSGADKASDRLLSALLEERHGSAYNLSLRELHERGLALERETDPAGLGQTSIQPS